MLEYEELTDKKHGLLINFRKTVIDVKRVICEQPAEDIF